MKEADLNLKIVVFKACLVAVWADSSMSSDERRYLSHLTEALAENEEETEALRELRLDDLNEGQVLDEIAELNKQDKAYVFDTCVDILVADRMLDSEELTFLRTLRKTCEIGWWSYSSKLLRARRRAKAKILRNRRTRIAIIALATYGVLLAVYFAHQLREVNITPQGKCSGQEILVTTFEPNDADDLKLQSGQQVFELVRDSIVSVNVFIDHDPVCSGSGSVIGKDKLGTVYILTNKHVIHNSDTEKGKPGDRVRFEVQQYSGAKFDAEVDYYSRKHDIALLSVRGMDQYTRPLKMILKKDMHVGQPVYAIGSPIGLKDTFTAGVVSALRDSYLQTDATAYYGSSGGPLVDQHGALCAVVTKGYGQLDYNLAIYSDIVLEVLKEHRKILPKHPKPRQQEGKT